MVIVAHTWPLGGFGAAPEFAGMDSGTWAVAGFFSISGYLIAGSRLRLRFGDYLLRRALRIFPGFWVCLVIVAFGFASLSVALDAPGSWSVGDALQYVAANFGLKMRAYNVGTTIWQNPYPLAWDGSLWTLFFEFGAYLVIGALLGNSVVRRWPSVSMALLLVITTIGYYLSADFHINSGYVRNGLDLGTFFVAGVLLYSVRLRLPRSRTLLVLAVGVLVAIGTCDVPRLLVALPFAYILLYLGSTLPTRIGSKNDVSYGVYVYAFPVQQLLAARHVQREGKLVFMLAALVLTLPLAWLSWLLVERPAMKLRRKFKRRTPKSGTVIPRSATDQSVAHDVPGADSVQ